MNLFEKRLKMNIKSTVLLWDWDGTLLYTRPAFERAFSELKKEFPCPYFSSENFEKLLKNWGAFWDGCPLSDDEKKKAMRFYGDTYKKINTTASRLMPQAKEVLQWAKENGFKQILVSNKVQWAIDDEVGYFGIKDCFVKIQGVEVGLHPDKKPSRIYGERALANVNYTDIIVIGDSKDDILFAQNLSAKCLYLGEGDTSDFDGRQVSSLTDVQVYLQKIVSTEQHHSYNKLNNQRDGYTG